LNPDLQLACYVVQAVSGLNLSTNISIGCSHKMTCLIINQAHLFRSRVPIVKDRRITNARSLCSRTPSQLLSGVRRTDSERRRRTDGEMLLMGICGNPRLLTSQLR
jgi:hypothetical protein